MDLSLVLKALLLVPVPQDALKTGLGIRSFAHFAHSLISLKSNEQLVAIRSDRSRQMSDCEKIAQFAQRK